MHARIESNPPRLFQIRAKQPYIKARIESDPHSAKSESEQTIRAQMPGSRATSSLLIPNPNKLSEQMCSNRKRPPSLLNPNPSKTPESMRARIESDHPMLNPNPSKQSEYRCSDRERPPLCSIRIRANNLSIHARIDSDLPLCKSESNRIQTTPEITP